MLLFPAIVRAEEDTSLHAFTTLNNRSISGRGGITALFEDSRGYIWAGSSIGLERLDRTESILYSNKDLGMDFGQVHALEEDKDGNIWIGTDAGVSIYDYRMDRIRVFKNTTADGVSIHNKTNNILRGPDERIWLSANNQGLFSYDPARNELTNYFMHGDSLTLPAGIRRFTFDKGGGFWISLYYAGFYHANSKLDSIEEVRIQGSEFFQGDNIDGIVCSPRQSHIVYLASSRHGLCEVDTKNETVREIIPSDGMSIPTCTFLESNSIIWMTTNHGVFRYELNSDATTQISSENRQPFSLHDDDISTLIVDSEGGLWIGASNGNIHYSGPSQQTFHAITNFSGILNNNFTVNGFAEDENGNLWITTSNAGLFICEEKAPDHAVPAAQLNQTLAAPVFQGKNLYLRTDNGMLRYFGGHFTPIHITQSARDSRVFDIFKMSDGQILATNTQGLFRLTSSPQTLIQEEAFSGIFIRDLAEDRNGLLWLATDVSGVYTYNLDSRAITGHYMNSEDGFRKIAKVLVDSHNRIWASAYNTGLYCFDADNNQFVRETSFPNSHIIYSFVEDDDGRFWLATDKGLVCWNPQTKVSFCYGAREGLPVKSFWGDAYKTRNGDLCFGMDGGFIRFNPRRIKHNSKNTSIRLSKLTVGETAITPMDGSGILEENIALTKSLTLSSRQNSFGFSLSITRGSLEDNHIQCMLYPYEKQWRDISYDGLVYYYNIPPGEYKFRARTVGEDLETHATSTPLKIQIKLPFWLSPLAILLYLSILAIIVTLVSRSLISKARRKEQYKQEEIQKLQEQQTYEEKMRFFSNVIHEIKTPLTLIQTPLEHIISSKKVKDSQLQKDLSVIGNGADYINTLVKELLDFISVQQNGYVLEKKNLDLRDALRLSLSNFSDLARSRGLAIQFDGPDTPVWIAADASALQKILNNLIHNAVKYAASYIHVILAQEDDKVIVRFANDGEPIPEKMRTQIFKPFVKYAPSFQESNSFGIGLSLATTLAELHNGSLILSPKTDCTEFVLSFPANLIPETRLDKDIIPVRNRSVPTIMVVEDNRTLSDYLQNALKDIFQIVCATSGEEALSIIRRMGGADLVLTDINLPGMDGICLCREIKALRTTQEIPVITISAITDSGTKSRAMTAGAAIFVEKPFSLDFLISCIRSVLNKEQQARDNALDTFLLTTAQAKPWTGKDDFTRRLDEIIDRNLGDVDFNSTQLEQALSMSRSSLARKMKAVLDTSPGEYIRRRRLAAAARMLENSSIRISEVCDAVGFSTASYFSKCFKDAYGVLPAQYQKMKNR